MNDLILPWPTKNLSPNSRAHWAKKAKEKKAARETARLLAIQAGWHLEEWPEGKLAVWIDGFPPDKRHRDTDNFLSSLKASLDGVADAIKINDKRFVPRPYIRDEVIKGGKVRIRITDFPTTEGEL